MKPFHGFRKGFVRERASEQLQSVIWLLHKGFVKESASEQLQSVIKPFLKGYVRERASEQYSIAKWSFELQKPIKAYGF